MLFDRPDNVACTIEINTNVCDDAVYIHESERTLNVIVPLHCK